MMGGLSRGAFKKIIMLCRGALAVPLDQRSALALDSRSRPADVSGQSLRKPLTGAETAEGEEALL